MVTGVVRTAVFMIAILCIAQAAMGDLPGDLQIVCEAGVSIFVDDELMGVTNEEDNGLLLDLLEGDHDIRAEKDGTVIYNSTVFVKGGETTTLNINVR